MTARDPDPREQPSEPRDTPISRSEGLPQGPQGFAAARSLIKRLEEISAEQLGRSVGAWYETMRGPGGHRWLRAEAAVAAAINSLRLRKAQLPLLAQIADVFQRAPWFRSYGPARADGFTDASAQYVVTIGVLSLLTREGIDPADFDLLYGPIGHAVRLESLDHDNPRAN